MSSQEGFQNSTSTLYVHTELRETSAGVKGPFPSGAPCHRAAATAALHTGSHDAVEDADGSSRQIAWLHGGREGAGCPGRSSLITCECQQKESGLLLTVGMLRNES